MPYVLLVLLKHLRFNIPQLFYQVLIILYQYNYIYPIGVNYVNFNKKVNCAFSAFTAVFIPVGVDVHLQTDKLRDLYDTSELVDEMMKMEYEDDTTILANQGVGIGVGVPMDRKERGRVRRNTKVLK